jgi:hypothetical protein
VVLHQIYVDKVQRIAIPKARQLGISTLCAIIGLDITLFNQEHHSEHRGQDRSPTR